ncbi:MAG: hypothetical protein ACP5HM_02200 [Anaerolineae bacterium]
MSRYLNACRRWTPHLLGLVLLLLLLTGGPPPQDQEFRLDVLSNRYAFDFVTWELKTIFNKVAYGLLSPQRFMSETERARYVLEYLDNVTTAHNLAAEIDRLYSDPAVADPAVATRAQRRRLNELRAFMEVQGAVAEAILEEQVSRVLGDEGFGVLRQILPPVRGAITPLPHLLVVSPRAHIERLYQKELIPGMTIEQQVGLEQRIEAELPHLSSYVTAIGGLAAYPAMLLESNSIDWLADVMAHEWTHHYLLPRPLGWNYFNSAEARTVNETAASLVGEWGGQEVVRRFYAPLLDREKRFPDPLVKEESPSAPPTFDFHAEMRETRVTVDRLLAQGRIEQAEAYMEARRQLFVEHGYYIRRLNQAYFAFHGAYASLSSSGAAGDDPTGPAVRRVWALSASPRLFLRKLGSATTLTEVLALEAQLSVAPQP